MISRVNKLGAKNYFKQIIYMLTYLPEQIANKRNPTAAAPNKIANVFLRPKYSIEKIASNKP